jgi:hypothetical protein
MGSAFNCHSELRLLAWKPPRSANAAKTEPAAASGTSGASAPKRNTRWWLRCGLCLVGQAEAGQHHAGEAGAEFLESCTAGDRLGQTLREFIELVVHTFPFVLVWFVIVVWFEALLGKSVKREGNPAMPLGAHTGIVSKSPDGGAK